jgi:hypothetical protein
VLYDIWYLVTRLLGLACVLLLLGGAGWLWRASARPGSAEHDATTSLLGLAQRYERLHWMLVAVLCWTGLAILGAFESASLHLRTVPGARLQLTLLVLLLVLALSLVRTLLLARIVAAQRGEQGEGHRLLLHDAYGASAVGLAVLLVLSVALANG